MNRAMLILLSVFVIIVAVGSDAIAHVSQPSRMVVEIKGGECAVEIKFDLAAVVMDVAAGHVDGEVAAAMRSMPVAELSQQIDKAEREIRAAMAIRFDGVAAELKTLEFPTAGSLIPSYKDAPIPAVCTARFTAPLPEGAKELVVTSPMVPMILTVGREGDVSPAHQVVDKSAESWPFVLASGQFDATRGVPSGVLVGVQYLMLGFEHIVPKGLDHILFVLSLFLLSPRLKPLLWQVTAFTIAHSVTLALAIYGVFSLPGRIVEPLIALSIATIAVENLWTTQLKPWRPAVVFAFGLLHGLGFAGVLTELGLPREDFVTALVTFNVGVEFGQLTVIALAFAAVGWFRNREWYRLGVTVPASCCIALIGLYWTYERIWM